MERGLRKVGTRPLVTSESAAMQCLASRPTVYYVDNGRFTKGGHSREDRQVGRAR